MVEVSELASDVFGADGGQHLFYLHFLSNLDVRVPT